jgi:hypothetical protein
MLSRLTGDCWEIYWELTRSILLRLFDAFIAARRDGGMAML